LKCDHHPYGYLKQQSKPDIQKRNCEGFIKGRILAECMNIVTKPVPVYVLWPVKGIFQKAPLPKKKGGYDCGQEEKHHTWYQQEKPEFIP
jgi:hypothetical protein